MRIMRSREREYRQRCVWIENFSCWGGKREIAKDNEIKMSVK